MLKSKHTGDFSRTNFIKLEVTSHIEIKLVSSSCVNGGASRDRTDDPLLAKQVLSQLSYGPMTCLLRHLYDDYLSKGPLFEEQGGDSRRIDSMRVERQRSYPDNGGSGKI